jgi:hypothetical protein
MFRPKTRPTTATFGVANSGRGGILIDSQGR